VSVNYAVDEPPARVASRATTYAQARTADWQYFVISDASDLTDTKAVHADACRHKAVGPGVAQPLAGPLEA
jgi:hypothetical protein